MEFFELQDDHLGEAALARNAAKQAVKEKRYDDAWRHLCDQQRHWINHANADGYTKQQTLDLLASINEQMANIHRIEGRYHDALAQLIYSIGSDSRPPKSRVKKLNAYFDRCKFDPKYNSRQAEIGVRKVREEPNYSIARDLVQAMRSGTAIIEK